jgi:predicted transcriptional regulator
MATVELPAQHRALIAGKMRQMQVSQSQLGKVLGLDQGTISQKLSGKRPLYEAELAKIVEVLELEELMESYPAMLCEADRSHQRVQTILQVMEETFTRLSVKDTQEVLLGLAFLLEGRRPYGETPQTKRLRGLAQGVASLYRADVAQRHESSSGASPLADVRYG